MNFVKKLMKKFSSKCIYLFSIFIFSQTVSCSPTTTEKVEKEVEIPDNLSAKNDSISILNQEGQLSNPILMYGSTFGNYFQAYYKVGDFDLLMKFTSKESIDKFGKHKILDAYENMQFAYKIKFKSMKNLGKDEWLMNYETEQNATIKMLRIKVKLENDTVKLVINDLKNIFQD